MVGCVLSCRLLYSIQTYFASHAVKLLVIGININDRCPIGCVDCRANHRVHVRSLFMLAKPQNQTSEKR